MPPGVVIVPSTSIHTPVLRTLLADGSVLDGVYPFLDRRDVAALVFDSDDADLRTILIGGAVAGAVGLVQGEILIFVAPAFRRSGVATAALGAYLSDLAANGHVTVAASVARSNVVSRRLLASAGFIERGLRHAPRAREPLVDFRLRFAE